MTRFVILAVPRTGSNLLCTLLNSHRQILCHHEVFNPQGVFAAHDYRGPALDIHSLSERDRDPLAFLDRVWQTAADSHTVGFKWTRGQNEDVLRSVVNDGGIKKLVLSRRNRIKTFVSEMIARETQQWEVYSTDDLTTPRPRIQVDMGELLKYIAVNQRFYHDLSGALSGAGQPHLTIDYEMLFHSGVQKQILEFLDVAVEVPLRTSSVKQNPVQLRDSIVNFGELEASLPCRELLHELYDCGM